MTIPAHPQLEDSRLRVSDLRDRIEITDLIYHLYACMDEHRFEELDALFTEDATATTPGGTVQGRTLVIAQATRNHKDYDRLHHVITNVLVDLAGDRATVRANLVATFVRDARQPEFAIGGVCRLRAQRTAQGWRLAGIEITPVWRVAPE